MFEMLSCNKTSVVRAQQRVGENLHRAKEREMVGFPPSAHLLHQISAVFDGAMQRVCLFVCFCLFIERKTVKMPWTQNCFSSFHQGKMTDWHCFYFKSPRRLVFRISVSRVMGNTLQFITPTHTDVQMPCESCPDSLTVLESRERDVRNHKHINGTWGSLSCGADYTMPLLLQQKGGEEARKSVLF